MERWGSVLTSPPSFNGVTDVVSIQPCAGTSDITPTARAVFIEVIHFWLFFILQQSYSRTENFVASPPNPPTHQTNSLHKVKGRGFFIQTVY